MNGSTLGEYLRSEREKRGITIEQIASVTKINVKTLLALESDHYADLPAKPFVRGFVISYARFVGLDAKEVLARHAKYIDSKTKEKPLQEEGHSGYAFEKRDSEKSRFFLWMMLGSFIVLGGVVMIFLKPALKHRDTSHIKQLRASHENKPNAVAPAPSPSPAPVVTPAPAPSPVASPVPPPATDAPSMEPNRQAAAEDPLNKGDTLAAKEIKQKVVLRGLADFWVRYKVDDKPSMSFPLKEGKLLVIRARETISVQVSNPKAVEFRYQMDGFKSVQKAKYLHTENGNATFSVPPELTEKTKEYFPGATPLPTTSDPQPRSAAPDSTPSA